MFNSSTIRDWSLIIGRGATTRKRGRGHVKFYPYEKGGHNKFWGSFYAVALSFSHIEGGRKKFQLFKRGGGGSKSSTLS